MRIEVTKSDIKHGEPGSTQKCPIALAIKRSCPKMGRPYVSCDYVVLVRDGSRDRMILAIPTIAEKFIGHFDNHRRVEPFAFDLDLDIPAVPGQ